MTDTTPFQAAAPVGETEQATTKKAECMDRWKHSWQWIWLNGEWTGRCRCTTCGQEKEVGYP